jgi:hypothetical protein
MDAKRLRPTDDSATAIRTALILIRAEREAMQQRLEEQTTRRTSLLLTGTNGEIRAAEEAVRDAELDLSRLTLMADALVPQLADAVAREAGDTRAQQVRDAAAAIARFNDWFTVSYAQHAAALAEGLELERTAHRAVTALRDPQNFTFPAALPEMARAHVGCDARALGFLVRLPAAAPGQQPFWWPR